MNEYKGKMKPLNKQANKQCKPIKGIYELLPNILLIFLIKWPGMNIRVHGSIEWVGRISYINHCPLVIFWHAFCGWIFLQILITCFFATTLFHMVASADSMHYKQKGLFTQTSFRHRILQYQLMKNLESGISQQRNAMAR